MNLKQWTFWVFSCQEIKGMFQNGKSIGIDIFQKEFKDHQVPFAGLKQRLSELKLTQ